MYVTLFGFAAGASVVLPPFPAGLSIVDSVKKVRKRMAKSVKKTEVVADIKRNRLYFTIAGNLSKKDLNRLYTDTRFCVADLQAGFSVISDMSDCRLGHLSGISIYRKIMGYLISNDVGDIVRIIRSDSLIYKQIVNVASRLQGYSPMYAANLDEAEEKLAMSSDRNGQRVHVHAIPLEYTAGSVEGRGYVSDISVSGFAVSSTMKLPQPETEIHVSVTFTVGEDSTETFSCRAKVIRVENCTFAGRFLDLGEDQQKLLIGYILNETQREISAQ